MLTAMQTELPESDGASTDERSEHLELAKEDIVLVIGVGAAAHARARQLVDTTRMVWMVVSFVVPQGGRTVELLARRATWDKTGRKLGGGLRKKTGMTKETWFLSEVQHNLDILLFKHMDVHDPFRSKSSEIQLKKSNWIWIIPNQYQV
jgi:hypothetical protein